MTKIYTKTGDRGFTKNINGSKLLKSNIQLEAVGSLDELNSCLGLLHLSKKRLVIELILEIQSDLFNIGSFISGIEFKESDKKWLEFRVIRFETLIDDFDAKNKQLKNFILPGGSLESTYLHLCRSFCRRTERVLVTFFEKHKSVSQLKVILVYLNRLSDLLFVLARYYNKKGAMDVVWKSNL